MSSKVYPFGKVEFAVIANQKVSAYSKAPARIYYKVGFPNQPDAWALLKSLEAEEEYVSAALSAATVIRIEAGGSEVLYQLGTDSQLPELRSGVKQPTPVAVNVTGAVSAAAILGGIVTSSTAAAVAGTIPTGAVMDAAAQLAVDEAVDWSVINTGPSTFTVTAAADHTIVGAAAVVTGTTGRFRTRKTAANTFVTYRIS